MIHSLLPLDSNVAQQASTLEFCNTIPLGAAAQFALLDRQSLTQSRLIAYRALVIGTENMVTSISCGAHKSEAPRGSKLFERRKGLID